jgi:hypothetical protein
MLLYVRNYSSKFYLKNNNQMTVRHGTEVSIEENFEKQNRKIINFGAADNSKIEL